MHLFTIALAQDRVAELAQGRGHRWSAQVQHADGPRGATARRALARILVAISLASAAAVARLDACLAEDLVRPVARPDGA